MGDLHRRWLVSDEVCVRICRTCDEVVRLCFIPGLAPFECETCVAYRTMEQTIGLTAEEYGRKLANDIFNEWLAARAAG